MAERSRVQDPRLTLMREMDELRREPCSCVHFELDPDAGEDTCYCGHVSDEHVATPTGFGPCEMEVTSCR